MTAKPDLNKQKIELTVAGKDLKFDVTRDDYNRYINAITPNNKVSPSHNFCIATVDDSSKEQLKDIFASTPGSEVQIAGAIIEEYMPDLEITAKKRSSTP